MRVLTLTNRIPALRRLIAVVISAVGLISIALPAFGKGLEAVYFTEFNLNRIVRINPDGSGVTPVVNVANPDEIAVDPIGRKIYYTLLNSGQVVRANLDGTNPETIATNQSPFGIALDLANGHVYWAGLGSFVRRANLDGTDPVTIFTGGNGLDGLALDLVNGHIYVTNRNVPNITRINLDGTNPVNFPVGFTGLTGIGVDPVGRKIYFGTFNANGLFTMNFDGTGVGVLVPNVGSVGAVEVDLENGHVYFGGNGITAVLRADLDGTDLVTLSTNRQGVFGIGLLPKVNRTIATVGTAAPGLTNTSFRNFGQPAVNRTGKVAFTSQLASPTGITSANDQSMWSTLGSGNLKLVAQENGPTGIAGVLFKSFNPPHLSDNQLVFRAKLMGTVTVSSDDALFSWNGTTLSILAREGDPAPVGGTWSNLGLPAVNDAGQVLFSGAFKIAGATSSALFRAGPNGAPIEPLALRGSTVQLDGEAATVNSFTHRASNVVERLVSANGYVGTVLKLSDGRTVLAVLAE